MKQENREHKFSTKKIRESWFEIFKRRGYKELEPVSLIPENDESILWINSGVATLKQLFSNSKTASEKDMVNCQKVMRTDDLSNINENSYHQTLFEMLGCFSIDSNFKEETIPIIWEWFTSDRWLGIDPRKLFITVWENDKEVIEIWKKQKNILTENIIKGDNSTNFWDIGDGPCGPNTEIYFELEENIEKGKNVEISDLEMKNYIEICNLVFPEFYHKGNNLFPLGKRFVDTGAGLERIAMVLQGKKNTFEIDIWKPIVELLHNSSCEGNFEDNKGKYYVIANHLRTAIFALSDGAEFEPKGRGYILKKLIKKASVISSSIGIRKKDLISASEKIIEINSLYYINIGLEQKTILDKISKEIEKSLLLVDRSLNFLEKVDLGKIDYGDIFHFYDTMGIPLEIIKCSLKKKDIEFDEDKFKDYLEKQRTRSKEERKSKKIRKFQF